MAGALGFGALKTAEDGTGKEGPDCRHPSGSNLGSH